MRFGVKNLRRLRDAPLIEIKPITLLVGRNSSGKSSFLRLFPLLRQSLMTRTSSPILWYGDLVDFGTYSTAVSHSTDNQQISFSFGVDEVRTEAEFYWVDDGPYESNSVTYKDIELEIVIEPTELMGPVESTRTMVSEIKIKAREPEIDCCLLIESGVSVKSLTINGREISHLLQPNVLQISAGTILPDLFFLLSEVDKRVSRRRRGDGEYARLLIDMVRQSVSADFKDEVLYDGAFRLVSIRATTPEQMREVARNGGNEIWIDFINEITADPNSDRFDRVKAVMEVAALSELLTKINLYLKQVLTSVLYIGPARAASERYYRYQDLSVSEIDPNGKNFPMFLNSLPDWRVRRLSEWIKSLFGYGVEVHRGGGHISINQITDGNVSNIVDTGYGVSQILPVLGQIWWARNRPQAAGPRRAQTTLLAIEQPELHLHPAHQALLADALVGEVGLSPEGGTASSEAQRIHFVVETHSETLINRLGELISLGRLELHPVLLTPA